MNSRLDTRHLTCPNCGSEDVKWRKRRWYDGPLNFIETMLTGATVMKTNDGISPMAHSYMDAKYMEQRQIQEYGKIRGRKTAELFWKCPACKSKGEAFEEDLVQGRLSCTKVRVVRSASRTDWTMGAAHRCRAAPLCR